MRILVTGSREWTSVEEVRHQLAQLRPAVVIHGASRGADRIAGVVAIGAGATVEAYPADWKRDGLAAGPIRNQRMLAEGEPDRGLAFGPLWKRDGRMNDPDAPAGAWQGARSGGWKRTGTGDMVKRPLDAGLPVRWIAAPGAHAVDLIEFPPPT